MPAMGCKIVLFLVSGFNSPVANIILVMTLCHPAARIGRAARSGVQFQLAMDSIHLFKNVGSI